MAIGIIFAASIIYTMMSDFNEMQLVKRRLFAMRNGALADNLRRAGAPYRIIFGVNLPQLVEIANDFTPSKELAERLWANRTTRESMLLAPMLYPHELMDYDTALRWGRSVISPEVADILCHKLLRKKDFADELADELAASDEVLPRYCGLRLMMNRFPARLAHIRDIAKAELERGEEMTSSLCRLIIDESDYLLGED